MKPIKASEIGSVMELEVGYKMQYSKPKTLYSRKKTSSKRRFGDVRKKEVKEEELTYEEQVQKRLDARREEALNDHIIDVGTAFEQWDTEMRMENRKELFKERNGKELNTTRYAVYGYGIIPIRTIVEATGGSEANLKAVKIPMRDWEELKHGSDPVITTSWVKDIDKEDTKDPLKTPECILLECDKLHTQKTKGTAYTFFHKNQSNKKQKSKKK